MSFKEITKEGALFVISIEKDLNDKEQSLIRAYCKDFKRANDKLIERIKKLYLEVNELPEKYFLEDTLLTPK